MNFLPKSLRPLAHRIAGVALALSSTTHAEPTMPETPPDVKAAPATAEKTASGLASVLLQKGSGTTKPQAQDEVTVHYSGWTTDGKLFDSSVQRGQPATFPLNGVIKGWTEGLQLMVEGEKRRFWIPANLAYGENPRPGAPGGLLVFDVELISIKAGPKPTPVPEDVAAAPADAEKLESGLTFKILNKGQGTTRPKGSDEVEIKVAIWDSTGAVLQDAGDQSTSLPLDRINIQGLADALKLMVAGEKRRLWIPPALVFGDPAPQGAPQGPITVDVELVSLKAAPEPPTVPADVAAAPANAEKTASGLASVVLQKGTGTTKPKATDTVEVHYSGWTTDGKMFDSSVTRGQTATFPLNGVIKGWTEGLQLMVEGEKRRFWIPADLAYGENPRPGAPGGLLVFDVELVRIVK